jgi:hypothetical protein
MSGVLPLLPLYAFMAWAAIALPSISFLEMSGTDHPVTEGYIPPEQNPQLHRYGNVETNTKKNSHSIKKTEFCIKLQTG